MTLPNGASTVDGAETFDVDVDVDVDVGVGVGVDVDVGVGVGVGVMVDSWPVARACKLRNTVIISCVEP